MRTNSSFTRTAKQSHHAMMVSIGLAKQGAKRIKAKDPLDGEQIAREVLTWCPKVSVKYFSSHPSSVGWKLRNPRVRELFSHRKVVHFDAPE